MLENEFRQTNDLRFINEEFYADKVTARETDQLLARAWRHFGTHYFRYSFGFFRNEIRRVVPLRIRLHDFSLSKSQRRIIRINKDLEQIIRPTIINAEKEDLFEHHKSRFSHGVPSSIYDFLSASPSKVPGEGLEVSLYRNKKLLAASFFDVGETSVSSIYAMFDRAESKRSLGIMTMLVEIDFALKNDKTYFYQGYCYEGDSFYDYKKRFSALEKFDWKGNWSEFCDSSESLGSS